MTRAVDVLEVIELLGDGPEALDEIEKMERTVELAPMPWEDPLNDEWD